MIVRVGQAVVPAQAVAARRARRACRRPAALMTASRGTRSIRPSCFSSMNALPKALELPRLPPGTTIQSGTSQPQRLEHAEHDRLLPFEAERVDAVHQVDAEPVGDLLDALHGVVEVAGDLDRQGAVVERLRELAVGDLARADEDDRLESEVGRRAVDRQRRRGVAGAGAGDPPGADHPGVRERGGHAVVLEAARGVHPLVLQQQAARRPCRRTAPTLSAGCSSVCPSPMVTTFSGGANGSSSRNRQTPREAERVEPVGPLGLEVAQATSGRAGGPSRRRRRAGRRTSGQAKCGLVRRAKVARQAGLMHCWYARSVASVAVVSTDISRGLSAQNDAAAVQVPAAATASERRRPAARHVPLYRRSPRPPDKPKSPPRRPGLRAAGVARPRPRRSIGGRPRHRSHQS